MPLPESKLQTIEVVNAFFGDQLKEALKRAGMTQKELAEKLDLSPSTVNNWIKGMNAPDFAKLKYLSKILNVSVGSLLYGNTDEQVQAARQNQTDPIVVTIGETDYEKSRDDLISSVQERLIVLNRTGNMFIGSDARALSKLQAAVKRGVRLRVMIADPKARSALSVVATARFESPGNTKAAAAHIKRAREILQELIDASDVPQASEILLIPYAVPTVTFIADPGTGHGKAIVLMISFRKLVTEAPMIIIEEAKHKEIFDWFYEDCMRIWKVFGGKLD